MCARPPSGVAGPVHPWPLAADQPRPGGLRDRCHRRCVARCAVDHEQLVAVAQRGPDGLEARGENLYTETQSSGSPSTNTPGSNGIGTLQQGYVETSNVNVVEELVNMIQTQRAYEINSKAVETSDQMLQRLAQL